VISDPTSTVFDRVNEPASDPTLVPLQDMTALPIVALPPAADRLLPTVALDVVPFPVGSPPLLPGPAAATDAALGPMSAAVVIAATRSHENRRANLERRRTREVCIFESPREEAERLGLIDGSIRLPPISESRSSDRIVP
jgi:hypothetical protein